MSDTTEPPPPLTQREMAQFITLAALPTLERALERLRWLEAELAALKAQSDPLAEMWRELAEYQPQADADGHGKSWKRMCSERTQAAAAWYAAEFVPGAAARDAAAAAGAAAWYAATEAAICAQRAIAAIRRAKEVQ